MVKFLASLAALGLLFCGNSALILTNPITQAYQEHEEILEGQLPSDPITSIYQENHSQYPTQLPLLKESSTKKCTQCAVCKCKGHCGCKGCSSDHEDHQKRQKSQKSTKNSCSKGKCNIEQEDASQGPLYLGDLVKDYNPEADFKKTPENRPITSIQPIQYPTQVAQKAQNTSISTISTRDN